MRAASLSRAGAKLLRMFCSNDLLIISHHSIAQRLKCSWALFLAPLDVRWAEGAVWIDHLKYPGMDVLSL